MYNLNIHCQVIGLRYQVVRHVITITRTLGTQFHHFHCNSKFFYLPLSAI